MYRQRSVLGMQVACVGRRLWSIDIEYFQLTVLG
jgi:hypothetical protein